MVDRHSFHLENVAGQDVTTVLESFCLEYYGSAPSVPPQIVVPRDSGDLSALAEFLSERRGARVEVRIAERGEKRRLQRARRRERAARARDRAGAVRAEARCAGSRRSRSCARRSTSSRCRSGSSATTSRTAMGQDTVGSMVVFQDALPKKAHYRKFGDPRAGRDPDDFAAMAEVISRRFARLVGRHRRVARRVVRGRAEPRRHRRRQGPALGRARGDAGVRPAARRGDRAREADRGGVRAGTARPDRALAPLGRAAAAAAHPRRGAPLRRSASTGSGARRAASARSSTTSRASARRGGARCSSHFGSVEEMLAATPEELEGVPGVPREDGAARSTRSCTRRAGHRAAARNGPA